MDNVAFSEAASRNIRALAALEGKTPEDYLNRYAIDIANTVRDRGGIEALEAEIQAREEAAAEPLAEA